MTGVEPSNQAAFRERMASQKITIYTKKRLNKVTEKGAVIEDWGGSRQEIAADTIVLASGFIPMTSMAEQLEKAGMEVYAVGDCVSPREIYDAMHEGYWTARKI